MPAMINYIEERRAKRALDDKPVDPGVLAGIMTAATFAPSCLNHQPWRFLVANENPALEKIREALSGGNYWAKKAPVMIAVITKNDLDCQREDGRDYAFFDCGLASMNLILQATKEGLICHPMAGFDPLTVKESFNIPEEYTVITLMAMGYPGSSDHLSEKHQAGEKSPRTRKPESEVICYNEWNL